MLIIFYSSSLSLGSSAPNAPVTLSASAPTMLFTNQRGSAGSPKAQCGYNTANVFVVRLEKGEMDCSQSQDRAKQSHDQ